MILVCKMYDTACVKSCKYCKHKNDCDYYWIEIRWKEEQASTKLLSPPKPVIIKDAIKRKSIITKDAFSDNFCMFNNYKTRDYVQINDIYVAPESQHCGIATALINYILETYQKDILIKCIKDSTADKFWSKRAEYIDTETPEKKKALNVYRIKNKDERKIDLWEEQSITKHSENQEEILTQHM